MNKQLNEVKRLQKLANILKENSVQIDADFNSELMDAIKDDDPYAEDNLSPKEINDGYCNIWADLFVDKFGGERQASYDFPDGSQGHVWVKLDGKYYDAEAPQGVSSLEELPFVKRAISKYGTDWINDIEIQ